MVSQEAIPARANDRYASGIAAADRAEPSRTTQYPGTPATWLPITMLTGNPTNPKLSVTSARARGVF